MAGFADLDIAILGSSNAVRIHTNNPQHPSYPNDVLIKNYARGGATADFNHRKTFLKQIDENLPYSTHLIIFQGPNNYGNKNWKDFLFDFYVSLIKLMRKTQKTPKEISILSPLPRGKSKRSHRSQMAILKRFLKTIKDEGFNVINSYDSLPNYLKDPENMFGINDRKKGHYVHFSGKIRSHLHKLIGLHISELRERTEMFVPTFEFQKLKI